MNITEIINNCSNYNKLEESLINYYLNNDGLRIGKEISLEYLKNIINNSPSLEDYCALTILEKKISEIKEKMN